MTNTLDLNPLSSEKRSIIEFILRQASSSMFSVINSQSTYKSSQSSQSTYKRFSSYFRDFFYS